MELRQLECFVALAEAHSISGAAEALNLDQATATQQLGQLERELHAPLFARSAGSVTLTAAGTRLLPEALAVLAAVDRARIAVAGSPRILVRIGIGADLGSRLEELLRTLTEGESGIELDLQKGPTAARLARVRSSNLHAAFVQGSDPIPGIELIPLWDQQLAVASGNASPAVLVLVEACRRVSERPQRASS